MYIDAQTIVQAITQAAAVVGGIGVLAAFAWKIIKWFLDQKKQSTDIEDLQSKEEEDIQELRTMHSEDMKQINEELCMINYAILACLDGLKQKGCNGPVTEAHTRLEKHLNKQAHKLD